LKSKKNEKSGSCSSGGKVSGMKKSTSHNGMEIQVEARGKQTEEKEDGEGKNRSSGQNETSREVETKGMKRLGYIPWRRKLSRSTFRYSIIKSNFSF
jgi:hypothetical protein